MSTRDLQASLEALSQAHRGPHPLPDELLAYQLGELDDEANERVEDHIALCSECARNLLDMAAFLDAEPTAEAGDRETAPPRQDVSIHAEREPAVPTEPGTPTDLRKAEARLQPAPTGRRSAFAWAAALFFCLVSFGLFARLLSLPTAEKPVPRVNIDLFDVGQSQRGGETLRIHFDDATPEAVLALPSPSLGLEVSYRVTLETAEGEPLWSTDGLRRNSAGLLTLALPRGFLSPGRYTLRLEPDREDQELGMSRIDLLIVDGPGD